MGRQDGHAVCIQVGSEHHDVFPPGMRIRRFTGSIIFVSQSRLIPMVPIGDIDGAISQKSQRFSYICRYREWATSDGDCLRRPSLQLQVPLCLPRLALGERSCRSEKKP